MNSIGKTVAGGNEHNSQTNVERLHFIDCCFPVFDFDGAFAVCHKYDFASPSFLIAEVYCLCLDAYYEGIDCWTKRVHIGNQFRRTEEKGIRSPATVDGSSASNLASVAALGCAIGI